MFRVDAINLASVAIFYFYAHLDGFQVNPTGFTGTMGYDGYEQNVNFCGYAPNMNISYSFMCVMYRPLWKEMFNFRARFSPNFCKL